MGISNTLIASFLLSLVILQLVQAIDTNQVTNNAFTGETYDKNIDCGGACAARCKLSKRPNLCKRACGTCCARCKCVPPGTAGNYDSCACYANMTTRGNIKKCP